MMTKVVWKQERAASPDDDPEPEPCRVVTVLGAGGRYRLVEGSRQWILQRRDAPNVWLALAFCGEKERLLRVMRQNSLGSNAIIRQLPDHFSPMAKEA